MKRRDFIKSCAVAPALLASRAGAQRPNVLWLVAEDFGQHLGCYGTQQVWTPNLDRLAAEGVRYTRFFTTAPVCSPSRSAFMTGMYQTTIGAHNHRSHRDDGMELPSGVRGKTDWNFTYYGKPFDTDRWADLRDHQPFFAQINFKETHRKYTAPEKADPAKVAIPPYYPDHAVTRQDWAQYLDSASELDRKVGLVLRQLEADGLADNTVVMFFGDNGQSHVRGKQFCYDEGLLVPMIIRWPRGVPAPAQFRPASTDDRLLASIDLAPTVIDIAGAAKPSKMEGEIFLGNSAGAPRRYVFGARDRCDETVFRFRTVRDARYRYIRNFTPERPFLQANDYKERSYPVWNLLKQLDAQGKLKPEQAVLCAPAMPAEELYDIEKDPHQIRNLAESPQHRETLARLRGALEEWITSTGDKGAVMEPADVARRKGLTRPEGNPSATAIREVRP